MAESTTTEWVKTECYAIGLRNREMLPGTFNTIKEALKVLLADKENHVFLYQRHEQTDPEGVTKRKLEKVLFRGVFINNNMSPEQIQELHAEVGG